MLCVIQHIQQNECFCMCWYLFDDIPPSSGDTSEKMIFTVPVNTTNYLAVNLILFLCMIFSLVCHFYDRWTHLRTLPFLFFKSAPCLAHVWHKTERSRLAEKTPKRLEHQLLWCQFWCSPSFARERLASINQTFIPAHLVVTYCTVFSYSRVAL